MEEVAFSLAWNGFDPWPGNFPMPWVWPKKKKRKEKKTESLTELAEISRTEQVERVIYSEAHLSILSSRIPIFLTFRRSRTRTKRGRS